MKPKRIERRVVNGEQSVTLVVDLGGREENGYSTEFFVDGVCTGEKTFALVMQMLALPGRGVP